MRLINFLPLKRGSLVREGGGGGGLFEWEDLTEDLGYAHPLDSDLSSELHYSTSEQLREPGSLRCRSYSDHKLNLFLATFVNPRLNVITIIITHDIVHLPIFFLVVPLKGPCCFKMYQV